MSVYYSSNVETTLASEYSRKTIELSRRSASSFEAYWLRIHSKICGKVFAALKSRLSCSRFEWVGQSGIALIQWCRIFIHYSH
jgi:hypothetical protein